MRLCNNIKNNYGYEFGKAWRNRWVLSWRLKAASVGTLQMLFGSEFQTAEAAYIVGSGVRPTPFLFYPHPFYKGTLDTENSGPPPF